MKLENYPSKDGYQVSLTDSERKRVLDELEQTSDEHAWILAAWSGVRRGAIGDIQFKDIRQRESGDWIVRVPEESAKRDKYREVPLPEKYAYKIQATMEADDDLDPDNRVVQHSMRTVTRHLRDAVESIAQQEGDEAWEHIRLHDGRRTFINRLLDAGVQELQVMQWSSHDDWRTFREHYLTDFSEQHQSQELEKVSEY